MLFSAAKPVVLVYPEYAVLWLYRVSRRRQSIMWMTPRERETSGRVMRASALADEFPPPSPEEGSEVNWDAKPDLVNEGDPDND
jgi:hypothetical protein